MRYEIVPVTLVWVPRLGRCEETPCADEQAMEWYIYATSEEDGVQNLILHAVSREIADLTATLLSGADALGEFMGWIDEPPPQPGDPDYMSDEEVAVALDAIAARVRSRV